ncbi:YcxB family protein [Treponema sp. C6A8]|uniref:YcxB family protein n=1 Tax=Treponema sp. C6A8 TaxID=1410609 RepID=UPI000486CB5E|nr:YcxB family protein [Treponema sp. C6A8]
MSFSIKRKISEEDFARFHRDFISSRRINVFLDVITFTILATTFLITTGVMIYLKAFQLAGNSIIVLALSIFKFYLMSNKEKRAVQWAKRVYPLYGKNIPETEMTFYEDKIIFKNDVEENTVSVEKLYSIYFSDETVNIYLNKISVFFVTKSDFASDEEWKAFYNFAKENYCKIKKVYFKTPVLKRDYFFSILISLVIIALIFWQTFFKFL